MATIELTGVHRRFGAAVALDCLDLRVEDGEILALLGPSGSGKTTALRLIAGFDRPDAGQVAVDGRVVADAARRMWVPPERRGVGLVFQDLALFPHLTVAANVGFGLSHLSAAERTRRLERMLALVGIAELGRRYPHELSGGQQQRVALARALASEPRVVLLDEPFASLDAGLRDQLREEVGGILRAARATAVFVTHDQEDALALADRIALLNRGRLEQVDPPHRVYHAPKTRFVADFVGQADFLPAVPVDGRLETELGWLENPGIEPDVRAEVMVRPDQVGLVADPDGTAAVVGRRFRGSDQAYTLALPSGRHLRSVRPASEPLPLGARVRAVLRPAAYLVFAADRPVARVGLTAPPGDAASTTRPMVHASGS